MTIEWGDPRHPGLTTVLAANPPAEPYCNDPECPSWWADGSLAPVKHVHLGTFPAARWLKAV